MRRFDFARFLLWGGLWIFLVSYTVLVLGGQLPAPPPPPWMVTSYPAPIPPPDNTSTATNSNLGASTDFSIQQESGPVTQTPSQNQVPSHVPAQAPPTPPQIYVLMVPVPTAGGPNVQQNQTVNQTVQDRPDREAHGRRSRRCGHEEQNCRHCDGHNHGHPCQGNCGCSTTFVPQEQRPCFCTPRFSDQVPPPPYVSEPNRVTPSPQFVQPPGKAGH